jgi:hypothetical protein
LLWILAKTNCDFVIRPRGGFISMRTRRRTFGKDVQRGITSRQAALGGEKKWDATHRRRYWRMVCLASSCIPINRVPHEGIAGDGLRLKERQRNGEPVNLTAVDDLAAREIITGLLGQGGARISGISIVSSFTQIPIHASKD